MRTDKIRQAGGRVLDVVGTAMIGVLAIGATYSAWHSYTDARKLYYRIKHAPVERKVLSKIEQPDCGASRTVYDDGRIVYRLEEGCVGKKVVGSPPVTVDARGPVEYLFRPEDLREVLAAGESEADPLEHNVSDVNTPDCRNFWDVRDMVHGGCTEWDGRPVSMREYVERLSARRQ